MLSNFISQKTQNMPIKLKDKNSNIKYEMKKVTITI